AMLSRHFRRVFVSLTILLIPAASQAQERGSITGTVLDSLGAAVSGASVALLRGDAQVAQTTTGARGAYVFDSLASDRYQVEVRAEGFQTHRTDPIFVAASGRALMNVQLQIGPLSQEVTVTATSTEVPISQLGAQVTVLDGVTLDALGKPDVLEAL